MSDQSSRTFSLLHEKIQRWVWEQGWTSFKDVQEQSIEPILNGKTDVIIAAPTAQGKTEAAILPIASRIAEDNEPGAKLLYISPLKALINDQYRRQSEIFEKLDISIVRWHGDASATLKKRFIQKPSGALLITPESMESIFVNHGPDVARIFSTLRYILIDELHSFIGTERGRQLQSLLNRLDIVLKVFIPRIGLSATIGEMSMAAEFLRPRRGNEVSIIVSDEGSQELKLIVRGYKTVDTSQDQNRKGDSEIEQDVVAIRDSLFNSLRGENHLVFANSRTLVEFYSDLLRQKCEAMRVPNEFLPHHGSLSKEIREEGETRILEKSFPTTLISTPTLEMGIDIGSVKSIGQIGTPPSVASLRQRMGRSGRTGEPAILRMYIRENEITPDTPPQDALRTELIQTVAMVNLLLKKWYEPPNIDGLHFSTLIQQVLSLIAERGGITANQAWEALCNSGPFGKVDQKQFVLLLKSMGKEDLLTQSNDGILLPGELGERIINNYKFYVVFQTPDEFRLVCDGSQIGTLQVDRYLTIGGFLIFSGRRWKILDIDTLAGEIQLEPAQGGRLPKFFGEGGIVHERVRAEMFRVFCEKDIPIFLDKIARELMEEGCHYFDEYKLHSQKVLQWGRTTLLFPWSGDKIMDTICLQFKSEGVNAFHDGIAIHLENFSLNELRSLLDRIVSSGPANEERLAQFVKNKSREKYDQYLAEELLCLNFASLYLNTKGCWEKLQELKDHLRDY